MSRLQPSRPEPSLAASESTPEFHRDVPDRRAITAAPEGRVSAAARSRTQRDPQGARDEDQEAPTVDIGLSAAILAVQGDDPQVLFVRSSGAEASKLDALPAGSYQPLDQGSLEEGVRDWVERQTGLPLGYAEQLYTFGDRATQAARGQDGQPTVSIGYLALTRVADAQDLAGGLWKNWYAFFPWEDWRNGKPAMLADEIEPWISQWAQGPTMLRSRTWERVRLAFGLDGASWDEERVLERYELLYESGAVAEAVRDGLVPESRANERVPEGMPLKRPRVGTMLRDDHRRILAAAIGRVRAKIKYRPLVFELMAREFTLFELQKTVEAILGSTLHKQNFRRLVEGTGLVEATNDVRTHTGGRPAKLFRFRREVLMERPAPGVRVKVSPSHMA
jgi:hypothetical protein